MKAPPASTKANLTIRVTDHARSRWPQMAGVEIRYRAQFAYINGRLHDCTLVKLCRLRYTGSAHLWGFALYRASHEDFEDSLLPTGTPIGTAEQALDCACRLYLTGLEPPPNTPTN